MGGDSTSVISAWMVYSPIIKNLRYNFVLPRTQGETQKGITVVLNTKLEIIYLLGYIHSRTVSFWYGGARRKKSTKNVHGNPLSYVWPTTADPSDSLSRHLRSRVAL